MNGRKILIVTNRVPYPLKDGGNMAMNAMIEGYHNAGWQVHLLAMNTTKHHVNNDVLSRIFTQLHAFTTVEVDNELNWKDVLRNFFFGKEPEHAQRFYSEDFREKLKEVLVSFDPDVVQVESVYLTTYMPVIRKYSEDAVTVLRMHNIEYQIWQGLARKTKNKLKAYYLDNLAIRVRNFERMAWKEYELLLAITEKDAHLVQRLEQVSNVVVAPFSIDTDKIRPSQTEQWVGYHIGAMDWRPNHDGIRWFLSKAWPVIHRTTPKFQFYFAGRGISSEFMNMDIGGVHCMGEVPDADEFIADKKILIVPLWSGGGIRVKILEAMAAGKVVITTSKGIKGIEAKPDEHYLRAHTPHDFAKAIKWCLENKKSAEDMAGNARALVLDKYEQGKVIRLVTTEVEHLIDTRRH